MPLSTPIRRAGAHEPYPDAVAVNKAVAALERKHFSFNINETDTLAGTPFDTVAPCDGTLTALYTIVQKTVTTGGTVTVAINGVAVAGLSVAIANAAAKGSRLNDLTLTGDGSEKFRKGDRITVTTSGFATAGAVSGFVEYVQDA